MARVLPSIASCDRRMTPGERRLAQRLEAKLDDDYLCWYDVPVGPRQLHPDFIVLHPGRGLLVLEVKDWTIDTIRGGDRVSFTILTERGLKHVPSPLEQARQYAFAVKELLERDPALRVAEGPHRGRLVFPYGYGAALTRITRKQFDAARLGEVLDPERVICGDEMTENVDAADFQERLWRMQAAPFARLLTMPQIERIRWHLFPEIRIEQPGLDLEGRAPTTAETLPDLVRVMDLQQEQLARSLGEGHRVIHGVAGSGKTLILGYRCVRLAELLAKPILVLCYNVTLAAKLAHVIDQRGLTEKVAVRHFHGWCHDQLKLYGVPKPEPGEGFFDRMVETVIRAVERGQIPSAQYGAVLIDEGHDFRPEWLTLVVQMVDPETNSLLVLYDDAQSIYTRRARRKFSFKSVGIEAQGRTTILRLNYRNTAEVLAVAHEFARDVLTPEAAEEDGVPLIEPATAGRHGPAPELVRRPSLKAEGHHIAEWLRARHDEGRAWNEMAVVYRSQFMGEEVVQALRQAGIPVEWLQETKARRHFDPGHDSVKVLTMHSSKGLEFPVVAIPGIGFMPYEKESPEDEARLLYVAMTRATDRLLLTSHKESAFAARLGAACLKRAA
ncbi:MAG: NERD domain-containing protein [Burkholderiales bacterium]|nr:NERD domain-containing protein [Burkholderiales bacterium]